MVVQCVKWSYKSWTYYIKLYVVFACKSILFQVHMCVIYIHNLISVSFILFHFVYLIFISIFRVANQIPIIHMGRSRRWDCLVVWFCFQLMARLDGRMVVTSWPGPCEISQNLVIYPTKWILIYTCITRTSMYVCIILSFIIRMFDINRSVFLTWHQLFICIIWKLCWFLFTKWACLISMYKLFTVIFIYFKICAL